MGMNMPKDENNYDEEPKPKFKIVDRRRIDMENLPEPGSVPERDKPKPAAPQTATPPGEEPKVVEEEVISLPDEQESAADT
jgi:hypothetical protein